MPTNYLASAAWHPSLKPSRWRTRHQQQCTKQPLPPSPLTAQTQLSFSPTVVPAHPLHLTNFWTTTRTTTTATTLTYRRFCDHSLWICWPEASQLLPSTNSSPASITEMPQHTLPFVRPITEENRGLNHCCRPHPQGGNVARSGCRTRTDSRLNNKRGVRLQSLPNYIPAVSNAVSSSGKPERSNTKRIPVYKKETTPHMRIFIYKAAASRGKQRVSVRIWRRDAINWSGASSVLFLVFLFPFNPFLPSDWLYSPHISSKSI